MKLVTRQFYSFAQIGFIGLGKMGFPMAINLANKGHQVYGFDVDQDKAVQAKKHNITFRKSLIEVAKDAKIFVTMLPDTGYSVGVCKDDSGLFKNASPGSLIIDSSTISPTASMELNQSARKYQMTYVDAPVSGGVTGAAAGTLTFMVGAENAEIFDTVKPILQAMGKNIFNCSKIGAGQIAKVCNNMALAIEMIGISEALALGKTLGMDEKILTNIMKVSSSRCWSIDTYNPVPGVMENVPASRNYDGGFACNLMLKDLKLATEVAKQVKCKVQLGEKSREIYKMLSESGYALKDFGIIYDILLKKKNL